MLKKNEIHKMEITGYGSGGEGIGRIEDLVVFVPFTVVGDIAEVRIVKVLKSYCYAKLEKVLVPSPQRVQPQCGVFGKCGGCSVMQMNYAEQLRMKQKIVQDCIARIGKLECSVKAPVAAERRYHYRNKVQIPVGMGEDGQVITGFYRAGSHDIISHECCLIEPEWVGAVVKTMVSWMQSYDIAPYDEKSRKGVVRHLYFRVAEGTGEIMVVIVSATKNLPYMEQLTQGLLDLPFPIVTIVQNVQPKPDNVVLGKKNIILHGAGKIMDCADGLKFWISPNSFYQVNTQQMIKLYQTAVHLADIQNGDTVFDLYCGTGTISLFAARLAKKVIGVEIVPEAVADAKENMKMNQVSNCEFYAGDAAEVTKALYKKGERADIIFVDPPRKGCSPEALQLLQELSPRKIVYISCNPATLARDLKVLKEKGYHTKIVQPVDLFIHSAHIESVALVTK